jgi:hypothetical protein
MESKVRGLRGVAASKVKVVVRALLVYRYSLRTSLVPNLGKLTSCRVNL